MPAIHRLDDLVARKRLILARSDLHRQIIALEQQSLAGRWSGAAEFAGRRRWWLLGGALAGGWLLGPRVVGLVRWLPAVIDLLRAWRR